MASAFSITRKLALSGGGEGAFKAIIGVTGGLAPHDTTDHICEIIIRKDRYDAMTANEKTAFDAMAISDILAADYAGG